MKRVLVTVGAVFATWITTSIVMGIVFAVTGVIESDYATILAGLLMGIILISVGVFTWKHS